jgi:hypothetical protein
MFLHLKSLVSFSRTGGHIFVYEEEMFFIWIKCGQLFPGPTVRFLSLQISKPLLARFAEARRRESACCNSGEKFPLLFVEL